MAQISKIVPHIIKWETGQDIRPGETNEEFFNRAKATGWANDPDDSGGMTMVGVTMATYEAYCRRKGYPRPTPERLRNISYSDWLDIVKTMYWDMWKADNIGSQSIANTLVDWIWGSGKWGIVIPQRILKVEPDGIVGNVTLSALNAREPKELFAQIKAARINYIDDICRKRPANMKFKRGWLRRLNDIVFTT